MILRHFLLTLPLDLSVFMQKEKFMIYRRDAKKGEATYSPKSHSAPHFVGHYVEGMEEWASWYCFNKKEDGMFKFEKRKDMTIDTTNICSHLQKKLFEEDGIYHHLWLAMQDDPELTAVVRSRQLHIYRNGKKVLVLAGKSAPKIIREDRLCDMLKKEHEY